ncbi:MAG: hypothetical protein A2508_05835 [Candidatus Lambdaproteobacteria bacterium RIFOXYD12_FULL_49_8]|uniref:MFS transporter n=1 Tax=Candidatus Lambdaproteobacteria bacterium RIFOXYD2_FULL_50_16 TaxID=1817772 RepID=A0A1F6GF44_9PROT|nr:MAG: hypothetical protein A2527_04030 [Candidatus Lambdaproteobacteria bacterium RIFOXYD2_FULL_50_16]OGG98076.1 MAG: hypothetical protein A2508_05835 [Candidatus Lambdaproteobacteria bacterium RIFOXYD12_FULL_49_8]
MNQEKKSLWAWVAYDMGNSAFSTTVMAGFFPIFFKSYWSAGVEVTTTTARLGFGVSLAAILVALFAPLLGAYSDRQGGKKRFLFGFATLGFILCAFLALIPQGGWLWAIAAYSLAVFGFYGANIFYDSLLNAVAAPEKRDWVSSLGYSFGYLSGGLIFAINVAMTLKPEAFGLSGPAQAVQASFLMVALWWGLASLITLKWVKEPAPSGGGFKDSWADLKSTFNHLKSLKPVWMFLLAYWFYIDAVDTLVVMSVDYGMSLGFKPDDLIGALLMVQFIGFPAALVIAKLGERFGVLKAIFGCLLVYAAVCLWAVGLQTKWEFYVMAGMIGLVQGGIQALSRSYYARLIPPGQAGEFFGFYNMLGKFATILGPALIALVGLSARILLSDLEPAQAENIASRIGFGSLLILLLIGGGLLYKGGQLSRLQKVPPG